MLRRMLTFCVTLGLLSALFVVPASAGDSPVSGSRALTGAEAASFVVPRDVVELWRVQLPDGRTQVRYQQVVGEAAVLGGQLTVISAADGTISAVIGAYYPGLTPKNNRSLNASQAQGIAVGRVGQAGQWDVSLLIDPSDAHLFYRVESLRADHRWIHWIDAGNGAVRNAYDGIAHDGPGIGVKGDTKTLDTTFNGTTHELRADSDRQITYDAENTQFSSALPGVLYTDANDVWDLAGRTSPGHPAAVDAHFYANITDDFYLTVFGRNSLDGEGMPMISSVHFGRNYNNAFWNGLQMTYGDGDGRRTFRELSGGLDVVGHEFTHGVTEFTSNLIYQDESGALNEAFSDIMGNTIEFFAAAGGLDPAATPDFFIGEDVYLPADSDPGFRNMTDPREDADPDHYSERQIGGPDLGGVHSNSGIANHAYYLLVNGGRNAGCDAVGSDGHQHTADCDVVVDGVGLNVAREIFFVGFTSLQENSNFCDARNATMAGTTGQFRDNVADAWTAVGVSDGCAGAPPILPCDVADATIPFESLHPYENRDCTWTYDNGTGNFALHFSLLDVEKNFDYVRIIDANGVELAAYTGRLARGVTTPCITTSVVNVMLDADPAVVDEGFIVDAAVPC